MIKNLNFKNLYFPTEQLTIRNLTEFELLQHLLLFELTKRITRLYENKKAENYLKMR